MLDASGDRLDNMTLLRADAALVPSSGRTALRRAMDTLIAIARVVRVAPCCPRTRLRCFFYFSTRLF
ncbi:hypothetical protein XCCB100_1301 [Xanthomonas campestris pv. campestris]|uniref:Uncharacterized protein n=1 Tax=Xanthomonas campestris pv. campestris (strain B100) TaxID=509169 RepID=B0RQB6_XANCB|nr:hypothetical protein XCCB100_1301 [Xanthomonas campestris pv. campestris]